jgi:Monooxygenase af470-like
MIRRERLFAHMDDPFVVFLIGMRVNKPWKVHKWWPVAAAMPRMLRELQARPELGLLGGDIWGGRTTLLVQYWRSAEQLFAYARDREAAHLPAWRAFNRAVGTDGDVGVWHETYLVEPGRYENIYVNMPPFGLGRVGTLSSASGARQSAEGRLRHGGAPGGAGDGCGPVEPAEAP